MTFKSQPATIQTLNVQYWFAQQIMSVESMLGTKLQEVKLTYNKDEGIVLEYTPIAAEESPSAE